MRVTYAGGSFVTGDDVARVLLDYAATLGGQGKASTIAVPAVDMAHGVLEVDLLLGPASQMIAEPFETHDPELEAPDFVAGLRDRIAHLERPAWSGRGLLEWDE